MKNQKPAANISTVKPQTPHEVFLVLADDSQDFNFALKAAAELAVESKGHVAVLAVLEDQAFQPWGGVEARMREESRKRVEDRLYEVADYLEEHGAGKPIFYVEKGVNRDAILNVVKNNPDISRLILGDGKGKPNPLVHFFIDGGLHEIGIPLLVVPDLDDTP